MRCLELSLILSFVVTDAKLVHLEVGRASPPAEEHRHLQTIQVFDEDDEHDGLYRGIGTHYVTFHVGCPPQKQTVIVDTGSSRTGFPCSTCNDCGEGYHLNPFYEESESSCFETVECVRRNDCIFCSSGQCRQSVSYAEGSSWSGYQATDMARIGSEDEDAISLRFFCQDEITNLFLTQLADGITGLDRGTPSLMNQLYFQDAIDSRQFSLCLQHVHVRQARAGSLVFGGTDPRFHDSTMVFAKELNRFSKFWNVRIRKIFVFTPGSTSSNDTDFQQAMLDDISDSYLMPIIDSGTTYTYLHNSLETPIRVAWEKVTNLPFGGGTFFSAAQVLELPAILFQLEGIDTASSQAEPGDPENPNDIFVTFTPSQYLDPSGSGYRMRLYFESGRPVFGANWMSEHIILFDEENHKIGIAESDCGLNVLDETTAPSPSTGGSPSPNAIEPTPPTMPPSGTTLARRSTMPPSSTALASRCWPMPIGAAHLITMLFFL